MTYVPVPVRPDMTFSIRSLAAVGDPTSGGRWYIEAEADFYDLYMDPSTKAMTGSKEILPRTVRFHRDVFNEVAHALHSGAQLELSGLWHHVASNPAASVFQATGIVKIIGEQPSRRYGNPSDGKVKGHEREPHWRRCHRQDLEAPQRWIWVRGCSVNGGSGDGSRMAA